MNKKRVIFMLCIIGILVGIFIMNSTIVEAEITPMDDDIPGNNRINYWYYRMYLWI